MKKIRLLLAAVLLLVMVLSASGCGDKDPYATPTGRDAFATNATEFEAKLKSVINIDEYECRVSNDTNSLYYDLMDSDYNAKIDYTIEFGNGEEITLPTTLEKIEKTGWKLTSSADETLSNKATLLYYKRFNNENNEEVLFCPININESKDEVDLPLSECDFFKVGFYLNEHDYSNGSTAYKKSEKAPYFEICGIDPYSTIEETIKTIGTPERVTYYNYDNTVRFVFYKREKGFSTLEVTFSAGGNYIISLELEYDNESIKK